MRFEGRIDPGSGAGPFTGQRVSFNPARIAETRARLSRLLRPLTDGTVIGAGFVVSAAALSALDESARTVAPAVSPALTRMGSIAMGASGVAAVSASPVAQAVMSARPMRPSVW